jgi:hypothetical protein
MMHEYGQLLLTAGRFGDPDLQSVLSTQRGTGVCQSCNCAYVHENQRHASFGIVLTVPIQVLLLSCTRSRKSVLSHHSDWEC